METISLKLEKEFLRGVEKVMKLNGYATKTEFIREAIRDKMRKLEKQDLLNEINKIFSSSKHKTSDEELHKAREKLAEKYEKRFK